MKCSTPGCDRHVADEDRDEVPLCTPCYCAAERATRETDKRVKAAISICEAVWRVYEKAKTFASASCLGSVRDLVKHMGPVMEMVNISNPYALVAFVDAVDAALKAEGTQRLRCGKCGEILDEKPIGEQLTENQQHTCPTGEYVWHNVGLHPFSVCDLCGKTVPCAASPAWPEKLVCENCMRKASTGKKGEAGKSAAPVCSSREERM